MAAADQATALVDLPSLQNFVASKSGSPEHFARLHGETAAKAKKLSDTVLDEMKQGLIDALTKKCLAHSVAMIEVRVFAGQIGTLTALCQSRRPSPSQKSKLV